MANKKHFDFIHDPRPGADPKRCFECGVPKDHHPIWIRDRELNFSLENKELLESLKAADVEIRFFQEKIIQEKTMEIDRSFTTEDL